MKAGDVFAVTLAAGSGTRFGGDKLAQMLSPSGDKQSVLEAAFAALDGFSWHGRAVVIDPARARGWRHAASPIVNAQPDSGMGHSLALGVQAALASGATAMLLTLGDMPRVLPSTIAALLAAAPDGEAALAATMPPDGPLGPPALIGRHWLPRLASAKGDSGARDLLRDPAIRTTAVPIDAAEAIDIDTRADLERARRGE